VGRVQKGEKKVGYRKGGVQKREKVGYRKGRVQKGENATVRQCYCIDLWVNDSALLTCTDLERRNELLVHVVRGERVLVVVGGTSSECKDRSQ
jgi:hypothetical protein